MTGIIWELLNDEIDADSAMDLQLKYRESVIMKPFPYSKTITGVDISYSTKEDGFGVAVAVTLAFPSMSIIEVSDENGKINFPYIPGLLAFRELNLMSKAILGLKTRPELLVCDGHGIAHPRYFGSASQIGVALGIPSIGCAKKIFFGEEIGEPSQEKFATSELREGERHFGHSVRMGENLKPVFISPGHFVDLNSALEIMKKCSIGYRIPEPTRQADILSRKILRKMVI